MVIQEIKVHDSCVLKTDTDFVMLDDLHITLTESNVYGTFNAFGGEQVNGIYNLCCKKLIDSMRDIDVLNLDVNVDFKEGTFEAPRDRDFISKHYIDGKEYELKCDWIEPPTL